MTNGLKCRDNFLWRVERAQRAFELLAPHRERRPNQLKKKPLARGQRCARDDLHSSSTDLGFWAKASGFDSEEVLAARVESEKECQGAIGLCAGLGNQALCIFMLDNKRQRADVGSEGDKARQNRCCNSKGDICDNVERSREEIYIKSEDVIVIESKRSCTLLCTLLCTSPFQAREVVCKPGIFFHGMDFKAPLQQLFCDTSWSRAYFKDGLVRRDRI